MPTIDLNLLIPHPANANVMSPEMFAKLKAHIGMSGDYPPIVVRAHPRDAGRFEILDGHHRAKALRELGYAQAQCAVWHVNDDAHAALLLLTLNRLHGEDDPLRRGRLMLDVAQQIDLKELAELLPDRREHIESLMRIAAPPPLLAGERQVAASDSVNSHYSPPLAVTFFLSAAQHAALLARLRTVHRDRSEALVIALGLGETECSNVAQGVASE